VLNLNCGSTELYIDGKLYYIAKHKAFCKFEMRELKGFQSLYIEWTYTSCSASQFFIRRFILGNRLPWYCYFIYFHL